MMATQRAAKSAAGRRGDGRSPARRADAERNIAAIVSAGVELLSANPNVSMAEVARQAGVGRVTLYAHFPSREVLVEAVVARTIREAETLLAEQNLDSLPADEGVEVLLRASWPVLDRFRRVRVAAQAELGEERLRRQHDEAFAHVDRLVSRGRREGVFRTDLPRAWLVTTVYAMLHAAADEVEAGRLKPGKASELLVTTVGSLLRGPSRESTVTGG